MVWVDLIQLVGRLYRQTMRFPREEEILSQDSSRIESGELLPCGPALQTPDLPAFVNCMSQFLSISKSLPVSVSLAPSVLICTHM